MSNPVKIVYITDKWAIPVAQIAEIYKISKTKVIQFSLKYAYDIDSLKRMSRHRNDTKIVNTINIPFSKSQIKECKRKSEEEYFLSFTEIVRRSIEKTIGDLSSDNIFVSENALNKLKKFISK